MFGYIFWINLLVLFPVCTAVSLSSVELASTTPVDEIVCPKPSAPRNGSVIVWGNNMLIEYTCDEDMFPIGNVFGSCNPITRAWSIRRPFCASSDCDDLGPLLHGKIYFSYNGSVATVKCDPGYRIRGSRRRYCNGYRWLGRPATCINKFPASQDKRELSDHINTTDRHVLFQRQLDKDVEDGDDTCYRQFSQPPEIENGKPAVEYKYNKIRRQWVSIANYTCDDGYGLEDKYQRYKYCKGYNWVGDQEPKCVPEKVKPQPCKENNGGCQHICVPFEDGRYFCECKSGFTHAPNPRRCIDTNECMFENGGCEQTCNNLIGSYFCTCQEGYVASGHSCYDIDECKDPRRNKCPGSCINTLGSFECNCSIPGLEASTDSQICEDINECLLDNGGCEDTCINLYGSFKCRCFKKGFILSEDKYSCEDVDECKKYGKQRCINGKCVNSPGSYQCECNAGFVQNKNRRKCLDVNECKAETHNCEHDCINTPGAFSCACKQGFELNSDGKTCTEQDECLTDNGGCEEICINTIGSYRCMCPKHLMVLSEDQHSCTFCDKNHYYDNSTRLCLPCMKYSTIPDYVNGTSPDDCICEEGFELEENTCQDVDECVDHIHINCDHTCHNTIGSAYCSCNSGYILSEDGNCTDIDECIENSTICTQYCDNTLGSYTCYCEEGFNLSLDNFTCDDIDECYEELLACDHTCVNFPGGATCECRIGYLLADDNTTCTDINECETGQHVCSDVCINTHGSYICDCYGLGFKLSWDKASCHDLNECMEGTNACEGECINTLGSYSCTCEKTGYLLGDDNRTCADIDECSQPSRHKCDQVCINEQGSYRCDCNPGYALASFHTCAPCRRDYYRSANVSECTACPSLSRTAGVAKTSISDCKCIKGYQGNLTAGESCKKV